MSVQPSGMDPRACRVVVLADAPDRLATMGLTVDILAASLKAGDTARREKALPQYPRNYPGIVAWAETLAELRRQLVRQQTGWKSGQTGNYETVYLESRAIAIAVVGGDRNTGLTDRAEPKLARKRGPMTTDRVLRNAAIQQLALELGPEFEPVEVSAETACRTWFLVLFADQEELRVELSLASGVNEEGRVSKWIERIILPALPTTGAVLPIDPDEDDFYDDDDDDLVKR